MERTVFILQWQDPLSDAAEQKNKELAVRKKKSQYKQYTILAFTKTARN